MKTAKLAYLAVMVTWLALPVLAEELRPVDHPEDIGFATFYWTGAWGTTFWVDTKEKMIGIMMIQVPLASGGTYRRAMRNLTYQALLDWAG